jgi:phosphoenolpyruvate---glycerone phosphotransferase subunit DhaK
MNGAVGEICGKYFDARGEVLDADFNHRTISIDIRHLRQIPVVVGVAAGVEKANAVLAAVKGRLINVLVTDSSVAREMLLQGGVTDIPAAPVNGGKSYA